jgi:hypothetical protein
MFFSFLPRLGSKERISETGAERGSSGGKLSKSSSKEHLPFIDNLEAASGPLHRAFSEEDLLVERAKSASPPPTLLKATSSLGRFFEKDRVGLVEQVPHDVAVTVLKLRAAIQQKGPRHRLVDALLPCPEDFSVKVRFTHAVNEYLGAVGNERREMGIQIVKTFIKKNSMCYLQNIPDQLVIRTPCHIGTARTDRLTKQV